MPYRAVSRNPSMVRCGLPLLCRFAHFLGLGGLPRPHFGVEPAIAQQLAVGAAFLEPAFVQDENPVRVRNGRKAVGDGNRGAMLGYAVQRRENVQIGRASCRERV